MTHAPAQLATPTPLPTFTSPHTPTGDPNRLVYGVDSYGFSCGGVNANSFQNASFDLSNQTNVHYLNALDLLRDGGAQYAKHVCVNACPTNYTNTVCDSSSGPCSSPSQFT